MIRKNIVNGMYKMERKDSWMKVVKGITGEATPETAGAGYKAMKEMLKKKSRGRYMLNR